MGVGMEMRIVVDRVRPESRPAVIPESLAEELGLFGCIWGQHSTIDQHRQGIVRNVLCLPEVDFAHFFHAALVYLQPTPHGFSDHRGSGAKTLPTTALPATRLTSHRW